MSMLCSSQASAMLPPHAADQARHGESSLTGSVSCSGDVRAGSPSMQAVNGSVHPSQHHGTHHHHNLCSNGSSSGRTSPGSSARQRHHARSFSTEKRFSPSAEQASAAPMALPVRAKRSVSSDGSDLSSPLSQASASGISSSSSSSKHPSASSSPRKETSPPRHPQKEEDKAEQVQISKLRSAQANRRPRVMRMTPAFSSLPGRMNASPVASAPKVVIVDGMTHGDDPGIAFPAKSTDQMHASTSNSTSADSEPGAGLQIDLACIPSPSLQDLQGPVSTSKLESMVRDRHGNPIKPSLKTPRSSVSHFMPGRTSRSDSTPALPSTVFGSKSVPSTPTVPKNVHFDPQLERVKLFKFKQRPTAVSRDGSPEQTETETEEEKDMFPFIWKRNSASPSNDGSPTSPVRGKTSPSPVEEQLVLRLPNFPSSTRLSVDREVFLERIFLADDLRSVKGTIQVRNMSFEKWVAVRYTLDHWATIGEVSAEFSESIKGGHADRFAFSIKLNELLNWPRGSAAHETKKMFICLRYTVTSGEFWDNNEGQNYQLDFRRRPMPVTPLSTPTATVVPPRANVPDSVASGTTRARVIEIARRGVGGKGVFAMEDLKRELEKLRSDDEEEVMRPGMLPSTEPYRRRASPPVSPGGVRSSSPSIWTARYDFGQSLRNPRSGSRKTGEGRAAALDYFSAKANNAPPAPVQNSSSARAAVPPSFTVSSASPPSATSTPEYLPASSFKARFGMLSPGLGDEHVEHLPVNGPYSASASPSPSATPTLNQQASIPSYTAMSSQNNADRFHSFPPSRHTTSPGASTPTGPGHSSPNRSSPRLERLSLDLLRNDQASPAPDVVIPPEIVRKHEKEGSFGSVSTGDSSQSSPRSSPPSDGGSPNPFSPSVSVSSSESDITVCNHTLPIERAGKVAKAPLAIAQSSTFLAPSVRTVGMNNEAGNSTLSLQSTVSLTSTSSAGDDAAAEETRLRPASMSDYQELVNRFCWNQDLVPSGGSMVPDMPVNGGFGKRSVTTGSQPTASPLAKRAALPLSPSLSASSSGSGASTPTRLH